MVTAGARGGAGGGLGARARGGAGRGFGGGRGPGRGGRARARASLAVQLFEAPERPTGEAFASFLEGSLHVLEVERNQTSFSGAAVLRSLASTAAEAAGDAAEPPFSYINITSFAPDIDYPSSEAFFAANEELNFTYDFALPGGRHFLLCSEVGNIGGPSPTTNLASRTLDGGLVLAAALQGGGEDDGAWQEWSGAGALQGEPGFVSAVLLKNLAAGARFSHLMIAEFGPEAGDAAALLQAFRRAGDPAVQSDIYRWHYAFGGKGMVGVAAALADQKRAGGPGAVP